MEYIIVSFAACFASALTLFSGFGLGTLLMPVVAIFFPLEVAVAITAIVHLANNIFKVGLVGRYAKIALLVRFGLPAVLAALVGALALTWLSDVPPIAHYSMFERTLAISPLKLTVGILILGFVCLELSPRFANVTFDQRYLPFGGILSGFFGGLSGHQGAFRSMFLIKSGLTKEEFVATGVIIAVMVDLARLLIYGIDLSSHAEQVSWPLVTSASIAAFVGAYFGAKMLQKITVRSIQIIVSALLMVVAVGLITGML